MSNHANGLTALKIIPVVRITVLSVTVVYSKEKLTHAIKRQVIGAKRLMIRQILDNLGIWTYSLQI